MPNPSSLAYDDEDDFNHVGGDNLPAVLVQGRKLDALPEITSDSNLEDVKRADLLHHHAILHNLNEGWPAVRTIKDLTMLAAITIKTLQSRREMMLLPTKAQKEEKGSGYFEVVD